MTTIKFHHTKKNPLVIPLLIAQEKKMFEQRELHVALELAEDFIFNGNEAFKTGQSDAMIGDLTFFFYMLEQGKQAVVTSNLTRTIHLVGRKGLQAPYEKIKVGVNRRGLFRLFLENDLKEIVPDAEIVWLDNSYERMKALENAEIDALVAIEPFVTDLTDHGHHIIWSTKDSDKNLVMWAFDEQFYNEHQEAVQRFHEVLEEAQNYFNGLSEEDKVKLCHETLGYPESFAKRMEQFVFEKQAAIRKVDFDLCQQWMYKEREITKTYESVQHIKETIGS